MARVLFFLPTISGYRDRVRLLMEVSKGLDRLILLVGRRDADLDMAGLERFQVVEVGFRRMLRPLNTWRASRMAQRLIGEEGLDVVHDTFGTLLPLLRNKAKYHGTWFVTSLYGLTGWKLNHVFNEFSTIRLLSTKSTANMFLGRRTQRQLTTVSDCVVLQAPGLVEHLVETTDIPRSRIRILTNSVDTDFWHPSARKKPLGNERDELRLLYVGGLDFSRGVFVLIETMKLLKERGIPSRLRLVGGWGPFSRKKALELISRYQLQDSIEVFPFMRREKLRDIYRDSDLFLCQTINEGSPRVVLEALACGLPVIASHHPGIDILDPEGDWIAFTDFADVSEITRIVQDLRNNPSAWAQRALIARAAVVERFSTTAVASQYIDFYRSLTVPVTSSR